MREKQGEQKGHGTGQGRDKTRGKQAVFERQGQPIGRDGQKAAGADRPQDPAFVVQTLGPLDVNRLIEEYGEDTETPETRQEVKRQQQADRSNRRPLLAARRGVGSDNGITVVPQERNRLLLPGRRRRGRSRRKNRVLGKRLPGEELVAIRRVIDK